MKVLYEWCVMYNVKDLGVLWGGFRGVNFIIFFILIWFFRYDYIIEFLLNLDNGFVYVCFLMK